MNDNTPAGSITTYKELKAEEQRLKALLLVQKQSIQYDLQELKEELNPLISVARVVGKFTLPDSAHHPAVQAGTNLTIDWLTRKILPRSSFLLNLLVPKVIKNYASHYIDKAVDKAAPAIRRFGTNLTESAKKG
jgi:hypothetical protein